MMTDTLRADLLHIREVARGGDMAETVRQLDEVLTHIEPDRLLTSTEAAHLLGIRSPNTVLMWCRTGYLHGVKRGGRTLIPLSEVERIKKDGDKVRLDQALDRLHDEAEDFGSPRGMTEEEMEILHQSRPGILPWERASQHSNSGEQPDD